MPLVAQPAERAQRTMFHGEPLGSSRSSRKGPDYATWYTKDQAAETLHVTGKTIAQMAKDGRLQRATWRRPRGPAIAVYHPADVEREARARNIEPPPHLVLAKDDDAPLALPPAPTSDQAFPLLMVAALKQLLAAPAPLPLFLTRAQAVAYSGLTTTYLRRLIREGRLTLHGRRIRKADLDAL